RRTDVRAFARRPGRVAPATLGQAPEPTTVPAAEPKLCRFHSNEIGISDRFVVHVLGIIPGAVGVDDAGETFPFGRAGRKARDPRCLR
ncbi:MAG: hypothetical protein QOI69_664, partial [Pseudonocardiales bacterium]|nr:hypothetical protein [Pseudonocardiales bacterium]